MSDTATNQNRRIQSDQRQLELRTQLDSGSGRPIVSASSNSLSENIGIEPIIMPPCQGRRYPRSGQADAQSLIPTKICTHFLSNSDFISASLFADARQGIPVPRIPLRSASTGAVRVDLEDSAISIEQPLSVCIPICGFPGGVNTSAPKAGAGFQSQPAFWRTSANWNSKFIASGSCIKKRSKGVFANGLSFSTSPAACSGVSTLWVIIARIWPCIWRSELSVSVMLAEVLPAVSAALAALPALASTLLKAVCSFACLVFRPLIALVVRVCCCSANVLKLEKAESISPSLCATKFCRPPNLLAMATASAVASLALLSSSPCAAALFLRKSVSIEAVLNSAQNSNPSAIATTPPPSSVKIAWSGSFFPSARSSIISRIVATTSTKTPRVIATVAIWRTNAQKSDVPSSDQRDADNAASGSVCNTARWIVLAATLMLCAFGGMWARRFDPRRG